VSLQAKRGARARRDTRLHNVIVSLRRQPTRVVCAVLLILVACAALFSLLTRSPTARAASQIQLQQQISAGQRRVSSLSGAVGAASNRLAKLSSSITGLEDGISRIQADLNAKRAELLTLRSELGAARARLAGLEAFEASAERLLSQQLISDYEADRPDIVSVVLEAKGFQDLLERIAFASRIRKHNVEVVSHVRAARRAVAAQATRLGALEARQQTLTSQVLTQRNALARVRINLVQQQLAVAQQRRSKAAQLADARGQVADLQRRLSRLQAAAAQQRGFSGGASVGSGQVSSGRGFTFPLPKGAASPPGTWSLDEGVDISAPADTPELAVCSGTIVLHGIGGFGRWAPVLHCDSPLSGGSYVYYGHAGPANQLPIGTHVGAGQAISSIGSGIVGVSTGPHIEIGFCDSSGTPLGGGTASQMMALVHSSYSG
jgi:murein DD-endopeptidase MepM/ murein hydrolase activator NlpD